MMYMCCVDVHDVCVDIPAEQAYTRRALVPGVYICAEFLGYTYLLTYTKCRLEVLKNRLRLSWALGQRAKTKTKKEI